MTASLQLTLLGGFQARQGPGAPLSLPTRKAQALLAYLALPLGQAHPRDKLAALLWGEMGEEQARGNLRQALFVLRKALPAGALVGEGERIGLNAEAVEVDAAVFERRVAEGTPGALAAAAALYRGELLAGLAVKEAAFEEWLLGERERLRELALEGLAKLLAHQRTAGATEAAIQTGLRLLTLDPLQEPVHRTLMRLYGAAGRRGAALRQYQQCVGVLQRELGVEPEPETRQLYQEILRQPPSRPSTIELPPPLPAAPALGAAPGVRADAPLVETPLIGRVPEVARLVAALDEAWGGRGRLVAILGEAGIGKSRLIAELAIETAHRGGRVLLGRSYESDQILPFGPWVNALRAGGVPHDAEALRGLGPVWRTELGRLLPELTGPEVPSGAGAADYRQLFESVGELVGHLAARQPLLLVLEDLHWADETSLRLLAFLARRIRAWPVLVVATAREEELADAPILRRTLEDLAREQHLESLSLSPLSRADTLTLVGALVPMGTEAATMARVGEPVWAASEGNPFMVVETMRALRDGARADPATKLTLPPHVRDVIAQRLERVSEVSQRLLAVAAVIGREFEFPLLERAAGLGEDEAAQGVEELVRRRVLHGVDERFDFTHDRIRDVVYTRLLPPRRKLLHRRVAEALEALSTADREAHAAALAGHYREAEVWEKALLYLRQAGRNAVACSAHREALAHFELALAALAHLPDGRDVREQAIDLRLEAESALYPLGELARALGHIREAESLASRLGDQRRLGRALARLTYHLASIGDLAGAVAAGERARGLAADIGDVMVEDRTNTMLGRALYALGDYPRSVECSRRAIALAGRDAHSFARSFLILCLAEQGEFAAGSACGDDAIAMAKAPHELVWASLGVGRLHLVKGDFGKAIAMLERGLPLCQSGGELAIYFSRVASSLGSAYALTGRMADALRLLEQADEQAVSINFVYGHSLVVAHLGEARLLAGDVRHGEPAGLAGARPGPAARATRLGGVDTPAPRRDRLASRPAGRGAGRRALPPGPRAGRSPRDAAAPGPLPPRSRRPVPPRGPARAGADRARRRDRAVPLDGHDLLAGSCGGRAGQARLKPRSTEASIRLTLPDPSARLSGAAQP